ncbi:MAG: LysM peptidoglycan-binding domain-containing protein [Methylomarinum sp.]|nr:LysM peptidoglycan-binding domain-containing protein [Methylomarinum sp.]
MKTYFSHTRSNSHSIILSTLLLLSFSCLADDWVYRVINNDTLWDISEKYLGGYSHLKQLQTLNKIKDPYHLSPGSQIVIPEKWLISHPAIARIIQIQGYASLIDENTQQKKTAKIGDILIEGDKVITQADTTLLVKFIDGSQLSLQENSHLQMGPLSLFENTGMSKTQLHLNKGRLETQVAPKKGSSSQFKINTPLSSTSVRGTNYRLSSQEKNAITEVLEGSVAVKSPLQKQNINAGFGIISSANSKSLPVKLLPAPDISNIPAIFERNPLQFQIEVQAKARKHRLQIANDEAFQQVIYDKTLSSTIIRATDLADGHYFLRLRAVDHQDIEGFNSEIAITVNALPEPPLIILPKAESQTPDEQPIFQWTNREYITDYHFQLADNAEFIQPLIDLPHYADVEYSSELKLALGDYYWRIAAIDKDHKDGPFGDTQHFKRIASAPKAGEAKINDDGISIQFQKGLPTQSYQFQLASDDAFKNILVEKNSTKPVFELETLEPGDYFIRGRTLDPDGFSSEFGNPQQLEIPIDARYWLLLSLPLLILIIL